MQIGEAFGRACRGTRIELDLTQDELGAAVGLSRGYIAKIEAGTANVTVGTMQDIGAALGLALELMATPPVFIARREPHDLVHARCVVTIRRRLTKDGWTVEGEVDISEGRYHAWADLVAFQRATRTLLVIEIKTRLDDLGGMQRQLGWYAAHARESAARFGWEPRRVTPWLICLSSTEIDHVLVVHREIMDRDFPGRWREMLALVRGEGGSAVRGLAMVDPSSHRSNWLLPTRIDGRRGPPAYDGYADAARRLGAGLPRR